MYVRVVRFTDVDSDRMREMKDRIDASDGPPEGSMAKGIQVLHDGDQGTAVVLQFFDSAEDMAEGERVFSAMDASETPGTRASVDACEQLLEVRA